MIDLHWPPLVIDQIGRAAKSYLYAFPEGEGAAEARVARILADIAAPIPDDPNTSRSEWPPPHCAGGLTVLSELAETGGTGEWSAVALGVKALCLEQVSPERHDEIRDAARGYLDFERTSTDYVVLLQGSLKVALWRIDGLPQFEAEGLDGSTVALDDFRGRITLLDFWSPG